ncbi:MAG: UDP-N-acetylmuramate:L-alanyl-gamma-D-glutamyl-meso-diaminopimelate ligase [Betaproteobacteria bacterium]|nr:UDP-N-acetylmuramate:L-alanyl-gamma-D-glutamyl-meso-diaminopimelate ligase [Betaproteobacteria bacterium]
MHIHILGICGTFMGGIAAIARSAGHRVTGCDSQVYPPMSDQLRALKIDLIEGYSVDQLELGADVYVIGNVVTRGNPLMETILNRGLPYISGPQWLAENVLRDKWVLAVAGTHGKTTTSAMLTWILEDAGLQPGFLIGGIPQNFEASARLTDSPFFVIEADEYDTAFFDKRSKFVHYHPRTAILNNLEFDHADIFADLAAIETQFHHLVRTIPSEGLIAVQAQDSLRRVIARGCWSECLWMGVATGWHAVGDEAQFSVYEGEKKLAEVSWSLMGAHNMANALAAMAAARHAGVPLAQSAEALNRFLGVKRRMEVRGVVKGVTIYDDFAHHPTAIASTLAGLRHKVGTARILAVLEPRSNTMKLGAMKDALPASLGQADQVFCYSADVSWDARAVLAPLADHVQVHTHLPALITAIVQAAQSGDHILVMSNGGFGGIHDKLLQALGG